MGNASGHTWHAKTRLAGLLDWQVRSRCREPDANPELFNELGAKAGRATWLRLGQAQVFCRECPVQAECLAWGRGARLSGIYGGQMLQGGAVRDLTPMAKIPAKKKAKRPA